MAQLSIILVNYKRAQDTIDCIESLKQSTYSDFEIVVVDNASGDLSPEIIRSAHPSVNLIESSTNVGFAEGNNIGIRAVLASESQHILLLNNDTVVDPHALENMLARINAHADNGIVGAKIFYHDRQTVIWYAGGMFNPDSAFGKHFGIGETDSGAYDVARPCSLVTGCCMLFRRDVVEKIGLLDNDYFAYLEDADFCTRASRRCFQLYYEPTAIVYHKVSSTSTWDSPIYIYFNLRNRIIFLRKNTTVLHWLPYLPQLVYFYARQFIRLSLKWRSSAKTMAAWLGLVDGLRNYTGEFGRGRLDQLAN